MGIFLIENQLFADNEAVADLRKLFKLADASGYADWLVFDASVVRGLAYYTGRGQLLTQLMPLHEVS